VPAFSSFERVEATVSYSVANKGGTTISDRPLILLVRGLKDDFFVYTGTADLDKRQLFKS